VIVPPVPDDVEVIGPTNRAFGLTFAAIFTVVGVLPLWRGGDARAWALAVGALFLMLALVYPRALRPANHIWLRIGLLMHRVVNPVVMAVLFYGVVTPFGFLLRLFGGGPTRRLRRDAAANTYWIPRDENAGRMDQQF
jgi:hypothetical protein